MLGLLAPVGGALYDRFGARAATASGMLICTAGLALLYVFLDGTAANLPLVMLALAVVGVGQGLFISPNSSAIMTSAPAELTGEAGSVLNLMRFLGISTGIAGGSALLALRLGAVTGSMVNVPSTPRRTCSSSPVATSSIALLLCRPGRRAVADAGQETCIEALLHAPITLPPKSDPPRRPSLAAISPSRKSMSANDAMQGGRDGCIFAQIELVGGVFAGLMAVPALARRRRRHPCEAAP